MRLRSNQSRSLTRPWMPLILIASLFLQTFADSGIDFNPDDPSMDNCPWTEVINHISVHNSDQFLDSVKAAAKKAAEGMVAYYTGGQGDEPITGIPGLMPYPPYYWWLGGAMFNTLIDYWHFTKDTKWNDMVMKGMLHQAGDNRDYKPTNQSNDLGNDDQAFWAMAALNAAETNFPNPPKGQPQWLALAQAVFNEQAMDWYKRDDTCGGGLMWQLFEYNPGYNYKNSIANGCFFNIGARLAAYTGNQSYADWAEKTWDWMNDIGLITKDWTILDGAYTKNKGNCTRKNNLQWSYNAGIFLYGSAMMYKYYEDDSEKQQSWETRVKGLLKGLREIFFNKDGVIAEVACEPVGTCNNDEQSFKAYTTRYMAATAQIANFTAAEILPLLESSAIAAAKQCSGPENACGLEWTKGTDYDGYKGPGEQMSAVEVFLSNLVKSDPPPPPANNKTGSSHGDPGAGDNSGGGNHGGSKAPKPPSQITNGDKAGASILTALEPSGLTKNSALILSLLVSGGGIAGYARTRSTPSIVAGLSVGVLYALSFYRLYTGQSYGEETGLAASALLAGAAFPRAIKTGGKRVPVGLSILATYGLVVFGAAYQASKTV
ncbi:hydrolase 76 protein [Ascosphaera aggregata]|nr:hydrolase 76 protein [Ascosphaera aggregata]